MNPDGVAIYHHSDDPAYGRGNEFVFYAEPAAADGNGSEQVAAITLPLSKGRAGNGSQITDDWYSATRGDGWALMITGAVWEDFGGRTGKLTGGSAKDSVVGNLTYQRGSTITTIDPSTLTGANASKFIIGLHDTSLGHASDFDNLAFRAPSGSFRGTISYKAYLVKDHLGWNGTDGGSWSAWLASRTKAQLESARIGSEITLKFIHGSAPHLTVSGVDLAETPAQPIVTKTVDEGGSVVLSLGGTAGDDDPAADRAAVSAGITAAVNKAGIFNTKSLETAGLRDFDLYNLYTLSNAPDTGILRLETSADGASTKTYRTLTQGDSFSIADIKANKISYVPNSATSPVNDSLGITAGQRKAAATIKGYMLVPKDGWAAADSRWTFQYLEGASGSTSWGIAVDQDKQLIRFTEPKSGNSVTDFYNALNGNSVIKQYFDIKSSYIVNRNASQAYTLANKGSDNDLDYDFSGGTNNQTSFTFRSSDQQQYGFCELYWRQTSGVQLIVKFNASQSANVTASD